MPEGVRARLRAAQRALDAAVLADSTAYVPYRTGALAASGRVEDGAVVWETPYARRVYYGAGMAFSRDVHPLAGAQWFETAKAARGAAWVQIAQAGFDAGETEG